MGWTSHELSPFQDSDRITLSVWDIPLWDLARQIAINEHIKLSTLVYQALRAYLADREMPSWGRVRDPSEYQEAATSWRVKRMLEVDAVVEGGARPKRKLSRTEEHYIETQRMLRELGDGKDEEDGKDGGEESGEKSGEEKGEGE